MSIISIKAFPSDTELLLQGMVQKLRSIWAVQQIRIPALPQGLGRGETGLSSLGVIRLEPSRWPGGQDWGGAWVSAEVLLRSSLESRRRGPAPLVCHPYIPYEVYRSSCR